MSPSNKDIAALIVDFLSSSAAEANEDNRDSLNVAIDCITEVFQFEKSESDSLIKNTFKGKKLAELLESASVSAGASGEPVKVHIPVEDAEAKAKAEELKLQGNKAMAAKNFDEAIAKYTAAIEVSPSNAVYYSNRAAAYSSLKKYEEAVKDAEQAIKVDPTYSKGYSRLGFAKYALNEPEEALEAYKKVLDIEGDKATDVMKRDYETAKKKVENSMNLEKSAFNEPTDKSATEAPGAGAGPGGMPDLSSLLGGGLGGGLGALLNNPQVMQAAEKMMQNPGLMQSMMQNPALKDMANQFSSGGGMPDFSQMMNDPAIRDMAKNMFGGSGEPPK
ncbi:small glutamine-rich tetratricopeptide repeat-containing protein 2 [Kluyveromyces marxianus]|uniref:Small glutamine-rich tetratricopeptide repeat-containing protein 2 n=2 Tax=Kluyveromyces marxianus TaxID=4911 RepID=W0TFE8_KLUMD|nr:small glutamine-rich tetratricopeptide repeat-containing protein 2 [Kluyveromyces marxianus DMKU3-1042]QGN17612.1 small glutamine-rich tetratricopeptide repeat-containing protein 2 [Kluyveromyces marxianus]BAO42347.1 small glutamine-rich tetratricopeptide repeat-containing protein 2 [Kluyveromyces marxianus DMKU3-1042]BAP73741.1 small glutamine-rich tetratricopeptide repeat-containing protein 2 [Kluyveromyces marxianus]